MVAPRMVAVWVGMDILSWVLFGLTLVSLAAGKQYLTSHVYQQDWATQKEMFWQMTWRAPGLKPDTVVLLNEGALNYYADNSLSAALNPPANLSAGPVPQ